MNYGAHPPDFWGRFTNFYTVPEEEYRKAKLQALLSRSPKKQKQMRTDRLIRSLEYHKGLSERYKNLYIGLIYSLTHLGFSPRELAKLSSWKESITGDSLNDYIALFKQQLRESEQRETILQIIKGKLSPRTKKYLLPALEKMSSTLLTEKVKKPEAVIPQAQK